nr:MAG TPA: hypothetical protein [Crassvirales sp.]
MGLCDINSARSASCSYLDNSVCSSRFSIA